MKGIAALVASSITDVSALPRLSSLTLSSGFELVRRDFDSSAVGTGKSSRVERILLFLITL